MTVAFDAIVIPGGGLTDSGELPEHVKERFRAALNSPGEPLFLPLSLGTVHRAPPRDAAGFPIPECRAGAQFLIENGVSPERILMESVSLDTIGNAFFARVIHAEILGLRRLRIITSEFHLERTRAIFEWVFGLLPDKRYELTFHGTANLGLAADLVKRRVERERASLSQLKVCMQSVRTLAEMHRFVFQEHDAYRTLGRVEPLPEELRSTY